ncbi:hypothetical protein JB92DRAFT_2840322 [Gautieria morchelliformis]|nr:hypothetical protein JB92DRAFT_2840322 [Gautieria morchelliformis]
MLPFPIPALPLPPPILALPPPFPMPIRSPSPALPPPPALSESPPQRPHPIPTPLPPLPARGGCLRGDQSSRPPKPVQRYTSTVRNPIWVRDPAVTGCRYLRGTTKREEIVRI